MRAFSFNTTYQPTGWSVHEQSGVMIIPLIVVDLLMIIGAGN
ncbi:MULTISPECIES: hypothetical protein [Escherichia]|nr:MULTISPECIES: hypothetical protein [Escherichia]